MRALMAVSTTGDQMPLYLHAVERILRDMRRQAQLHDTPFNYADFKKRLVIERLTEAQLGPLKQRLESLESFMVDADAKSFDMFARQGERETTSSTGSKQTCHPGTDWTPQVSCHM